MAVRPGEEITISVDKKCQSLLFLHAYSLDMGDPPFHGCTYIGWEKEVVGNYEIIYENGESIPLLLEYSRNITAADKQFCIFSGNPAYKADKLIKTQKKGLVSEKVEYEIEPHSLFYWEWENPKPDQEIKKIKMKGSEKSREIFCSFL